MTERQTAPAPASASMGKRLPNFRLMRRTAAPLLLSAALAPAAWAAGVLPSWREGPARQAIVDFVGRVTTPGGKDFVPLAERIAVFDNDGTLWSEQPLYFQLLFAFDRLRALAPLHPEWQDKPVFKAVLAGDMRGAMADGERGMLEVVTAAQGESTPEQFKTVVERWLADARHPVSKRPYTEMVYQPMLEMLAYLRSKGFKTYICSGGDIEFMRAWAERVYGVPPEQVIGSSFGYVLGGTDAEPEVMITPRMDVLNDKGAKPLSLHRVIGRRPIVAFGNSDGDLPMLAWTAAGAGPRLVGLVHHTDAAREAAYDRKSPIGRLDKALDAATAKGWTVVDMQRDWHTVFPAAK